MSEPSHDLYQQYQAHKTILKSTASDIEGPFYLPGAPLLQDPANLLATPSLILSGKVKDIRGQGLTGVVLDIWQADEHGVYDETGFKLRGKILSQYGGNYRIGIVKPGFYKISEPGQPDDFRCSHIHVKLWLDEECVLTTQLYFPADKYDDTDHWFDKKRCVKWTETIVGDDGFESGSCSFDFVIPERKPG